MRGNDSSTNVNLGDFSWIRDDGQGMLLGRMLVGEGMLIGEDINLEVFFPQVVAEIK